MVVRVGLRKETPLCGCRCGWIGEWAYTEERQEKGYPEMHCPACGNTDCLHDVDRTNVGVFMDN